MSNESRGHRDDRLRISGHGTPLVLVPGLDGTGQLFHLVPSLEQARYMVTRVPGATLRVLDGHGHICLISPDIDLADILREWQDGRLSQSRSPTPIEEIFGISDT